MGGSFFRENVKEEDSLVCGLIGFGIMLPKRMRNWGKRHSERQHQTASIIGWPGDQHVVHLW